MHIWNKYNIIYPTQTTTQNKRTLYKKCLFHDSSLFSIFSVPTTSPLSLEGATFSTGSFCSVAPCCSNSRMLSSRCGAKAIIFIVFQTENKSRQILERMEPCLGRKQVTEVRSPAHTTTVSEARRRCCRCSTRRDSGRRSTICGRVETCTGVARDCLKILLFRFIF